MHTCTDKVDRTIVYHPKVELWRQCPASVFAKIVTFERRLRDKIDVKEPETYDVVLIPNKTCFLLNHISRHVTYKLPQINSSEIRCQNSANKMPCSFILKE